MNLEGIESLNYRVASGGLGGRIEVRVDSLRGPPISTVRVGSTGAWQVYTDLAAPIANPGGTRELFFIFRRNPGTTACSISIGLISRGPGVSRPSATAKAAKSRLGSLPGPPTLYPPYPNPFNPTVQLRFVLPGRMAVRLEVFDILGQRVTSWSTRCWKPEATRCGLTEMIWRVGVYIARLATPGGDLVRRMVLLR